MKKYSISFVCLLFLFTACQNFLDVNHDPNVFEKIPNAKVLLPSAQVGIANNMMGWDFGFAGAFWVEYWTQKPTASQFKVLCEYEARDFNTSYSDLTAGALEDLKVIIKMTKDEEDKGLYYAAEALSIFTFQVLTDFWGDIPYTNALKGDEGVDSPEFDDAETIYADLNKRIDELLEIDLSNASIDKRFDFFFNGNMNLWKQFANSLKLKLMIRLSETSNYDSNKTLEFVKNNSFLDHSAKINGSVWDDSKEGKRHPMREFQEGGARYLSTNVGACKSFIDYLLKNNDPRVDKLFNTPKGGHKGAFFGDFDSQEDSDGNGVKDKDEVCSLPLFTANMDLIIMSNWEVYFYIAEVYARAGDNANAAIYYQKAVQASLQQHAVADDDILTTGYAKWNDGSVEEGIKQIGMQKWVAYANYQHAEAFLERNRLKYPPVSDIDVKLDRRKANDDFPVGSLTISVNGRAKLNGNLPASPLYPESVMTRNHNAPSQKTDIREKVWWNKKNGK